MAKRKARFIWVRCGEGDEYNRFSILEEAANYLREMGVRAPLHRCQYRGLSAGGHLSGNNHISFYWDVADTGGGASNPTPITDRQLDELNRILEGVHQRIAHAVKAH